jgi:putative chitinase
MNIKTARIMIKKDQLIKIVPYGKSKVDLYLEPLNKAMAEFEINNKLRMAAFIAQIAHESGSFRYVEEIASGTAYEGRKDLGNVKPGDGARFKGRGLIQITGRANYEKCGKALGLDLINNPELLEQSINAVRSAAWFWKTNGLNELADKDQFKQITKKINGGYNGLADREAFYKKALLVL